MSYIEPKPAAYLAAVLARECITAGTPYSVSRDAEKLIRLGRRASRIAIQRCNGIEYRDSTGRTLSRWADGDESRANRASAKIEADANAILAAYGAGDAKAHGDPRGHVLTFRLASCLSNRGEYGSSARFGV